MKFVTTTGLTELITKIKSSFINSSDVVSATTLSIDSTPTASSSNLITSGGVQAAIAGISFPVTSVDGGTGAVVLSDVKYIAQSLSTSEKTLARTNIDAQQTITMHVLESGD